MSQRLNGIRKIKTAQKAKLRSRPTAMGQEYLELFLMVKERERLQQYHEVLSSTRENTEEEIKDVEEEFGKLRKKVGINTPDSSQVDVKDHESDSQTFKKRKPKKAMKTVVIDY